METPNHLLDKTIWPTTKCSIWLGPGRLHSEVGVPRLRAPTGSSSIPELGRNNTCVRPSRTDFVPESGCHDLVHHSGLIHQLVLTLVGPRLPPLVGCTGVGSSILGALWPPVGSLAMVNQPKMTKNGSPMVVNDTPNE